MPSKWARRGLLLFAATVGLLLGLLRPVLTQGLLSPIGIVAGLGYFLLSRTMTQEDAESKSNERFNRWFLLIQMLLYFIIGSAIGSMIPYLSALREQQQSLLFIRILK